MPNLKQIQKVARLEARIGASPDCRRELLTPLRSVLQRYRAKAGESVVSIVLVTVEHTQTGQLKILQLRKGQRIPRGWKPMK